MEELNDSNWMMVISSIYGGLMVMARLWLWCMASKDQSNPTMQAR